MRVADLILDILAAHGVRDVFGVPGDAINDMTDALRKRDDMRFVLVRHEEAGAFMAAAQAKLSGRLAACMGTSGPGAIHLLNGLYDAKMDHAPVIAITGQVATEYVGTGYHQEVDLERLFSDVAVYSKTVMTEEQLPSLMLEACKAAISAPGVAHLSLPTDVSGRSLKSERCDFTLGSEKGEAQPCRPSLDTALDLIGEAEKVTILAGIGAAQARSQLLALSERLKAPIVRTLRAKDVLDEDIEPCVGGLGLLGGTPASDAVEGCDLLIIVGADYPYVSFYPGKAKIIQIETAPERMGRRAPIDAPLRGHARPTLELLLKEIDERAGRSFYDKMMKSKQSWRDKQAKAETSGATPIKPQRAVAEISKAAPDDAIFLSDTGTSTAWTARHLMVRASQRYTLSSALGSMAFALPGAIGAQLLYPERPVIAVAGDGGFTMLMGDFATAVQYELPITCVVLNNSKLGFIAFEQEAKGLPEHSIGLTNPDFVAFARACGGDGVRIEDPAAIADALKDAIASSKPSVVEIVVDPDEVIMPPRISPKQAANFGLAKIKEFLG